MPVDTAGRFPPVEEREKIKFGHPVPLSHVWVWLDQLTTDPSLVWLTGPSRLLGFSGRHFPQSHSRRHPLHSGARRDAVHSTPVPATMPSTPVPAADTSSLGRHPPWGAEDLQHPRDPKMKSPNRKNAQCTGCPPRMPNLKWIPKG